MKPSPPENGQLIATGKDGQTVIYEYSCEPELHIPLNGYDPRTKWSFVILIEQDVFQFDLVDEGDFMRVEMMNRNNCERYKARGIPEAFIRLSHELFKVPICSSKQSIVQSVSMGIGYVDEQHSADATKVWRRLVSTNEAYFDAEKQRFVYAR